jgi:hypothetical protein
MIIELTPPEQLNLTCTVFTVEVNNRYSWSLKRDEPVVASDCHYRETTKITLGKAYNTQTVDCPLQTFIYSWPSWLDLDIRILADLNSNTYWLSFSDTPLQGYVP